MTITRRQLIKLAGAAGSLGFVPSIAFGQKLEKTNVHIAVGGKASTYYLPLTIAEELGFFKDEGLDIKISDFAGGSKSLQAVVGGSADVVSGAYEHTINLQARGQNFRCIVLQGRCPMITAGVSNKTMPNYKGPADLKGKKVGVTAPGSSTNMVINFYLAKNGLKPSDISVIGVGTGASAITALRSGQIDVVVNIDPAITILEMAKEIRTIVDTRRLKDTLDVFGGNMPAGSLYLPQSYIDANPNTVQALTNAMVRANKWIHKAGPERIVKVLPASYTQGEPGTLLEAIRKCMEAISPDGSIPADGPTTALNALASFNPKVQKGSVDLAKTWTNSFVERANQKYPDVKV